MTPPSRPPNAPPPYSQVPNPWAYGPPPPKASGVPVAAWIAIGLAGLCVFAVGAVFIVVFAVGARSSSSTSPTNLPAVQRDVPVHELAILDGCSNVDLRLIDGQIAGAISVGAPVYNDGDLLGCYQVYDRAALGIETALSPACKGPARALAKGRAKAQGMIAPSDKAWAMRDAFDGLLDVLDRAAASRGR